MATVHGLAGEWARVKGTVLGLWPLFIGLFIAGASLSAALLGLRTVGAAVFVASIAFIGWSLFRGMRRIERFFKGARGEERVCGILRELPDGHHVFNGFVACGVHVDHVVVGPSGIYAVETKNWNGAVTVEEDEILVDGRLPSRPPLAQVRCEATLVKSELARRGWKGDVTPVIAFASDTFKARLAEVRGAVVINSCDLASSFDNGRQVLSAAEVERLASLMENAR